MIITGLVRLGRDCETRYSHDGTPILSFSGAFNFYDKSAENNRGTQWVELTGFGERWERVAQYLVKGATVVVVASDPRIETYQRRDGGEGHKFVARLDNIELAGRPPEQQAGRTQPQERQAPARAPAQAGQQRQAAPKSQSGFDDLDDDIPF